MKTKVQSGRVSVGWMLLVVVVVSTLAVGPVQSAVAITQIDIVGPAGSEEFGKSVTVLPSGNIVVTDPYYDDGTIENVGAVYLYDGATGAQISMLTGSTAGDQIGYHPSTGIGVTILSNGNFVVQSPEWDNGTATGAGAVTWGSGTTGISGVVSVANSLVGGTTSDHVGCISGEMGPSCDWGVTALSNGNYVVRSSLWDNDTATNAGAVTWGNGTTGTVGVVSAANSLVGSTAGDKVGCGDWYCSTGLTELSNGNYVVGSYGWDNGTATDAGAVTWGNGTTGINGAVSAANSLVGSTADDQVGSEGVTALSNGNYVVNSMWWDNGLATDVGAVTWGSGTTGVSGEVSAANSLVGSTAGDKVGCPGAGCVNGVTALNNGNYVVGSYLWDNGPAADAGAVTWGNGATGISGAVSAANSLVGSTAGDEVGSEGVTALSNGNYAVSSANWDNSAIGNAGAVTWANGATGISGAVSAANSLVGSTVGDEVGSGGVTALSNGNYVVSSLFWQSAPFVHVGAVTWGNGTTGSVGVVSAANSLVGSTAGDTVGRDGVRELSNGNYVVLSSRNWDNGGIADAGAVTWGNGTTGTAGVVSAANSLVGTTAGDRVGYDGLTVLNNGNYVVLSRRWDNGGIVDAGAATWGNGTTGTAGEVSAANSLVGSTAEDMIEYGGVTALSSGNYLVSSPNWDNGGIADVGAVTWGNGTTGVGGVVSTANSLVGTTAGDKVGYTFPSDTNVAAVGDGNYVVHSSWWDNGAIDSAGAVTWGDAAGGTIGPITAENSVLGTAASGGWGMCWAYDHRYPISQLVVGRPADNTVTLFKLPPVYLIFLPVVQKNGPS